MTSNQSAAIDVNTATTTAVAAAVAGKRIAVYAYQLANGVATGQSIQWKSGTNTLTGVIQLPASVGGTAAATAGNPQLALFYTDAGAALSLTTTAATQVGGFVAFKYV